MNMLKVVPDLNKIARPNWIEINLDALCENVAFIRSQIPVGTKILLPVKEGEKGLRQSDAVFHHTQQLSAVCADLFSKSSKHRTEKCLTLFLTGVAVKKLLIICGMKVLMNA